MKEGRNEKEKEGRKIERLHRTVNSSAVVVVVRILNYVIVIGPTVYRRI